MCSVMVIEDNSDLRFLFKQAVDLEGHTSVAAANGQEALFLLRSQNLHPDLILLDLMMPIMDGWEFLREKAKDHDLADIPVVVCSTSRDRLPKDLPYLPKPIDINKLIDVLNKYCG